MKTPKLTLLALVTLPILAICLAACERKSDLEKAADDIGDAVEEVADEIGDAVKRAD